MTTVDQSRTRNRRALLAFIGVLAGVVLAAALVVLALQRQYLLHAEREELQTEMALLGELATDALLRSDYATVEGLVQRWVDRHDYLASITAVTPNGFVLGEARKSRPVVEPLAVTQAVRFDGRLLLTLHATGDFSLIEGDFAAIVLRVSIVAVALVLLLGWLLWWTLQRTALAPLALQMRQREDKERELLQRTTELEATLQELESFSYSVSHDLRGPLRAIDGYSHALGEDYGPVLDDTARDYLARTRAAARRMGVLIDELLELARVGRAELRLTETDLSRLAHEVVEQLRAADPTRSVQVTIAPSLTGHADEPLMRLVLENLLGNAWKYTRDTAEARIEFGAAQENGETRYSVRDNGAGFDMQYAGKLFGAFQRLHGAEFPGTGVGLAIVQRIIRRHGGRIWAEAGIGEGASFFFTLAPPAASG
jgi:signal transduction histidine kinase